MSIFRRNELLWVFLLGGLLLVTTASWSAFAQQYSDDQYTNDEYSDDQYGDDQYGDGEYGKTKPQKKAGRQSKKAPMAKGAARWRHPVAQAVSPDGAYLYVGNERSGSLSVVSTAARQVLAEIPLGKSLVDMEWLDENRLAIVDTQKHALLFCQVDGPQVKLTGKLVVSSYPVDLEVSRDKRHCYVSSLWSRRVSKVDLSGKTPVVLQTLDLPFAPRRQLLVEDRNRLIVADSFSGWLGLVSLDTFQFEERREFPGHNIRGMARSPDESRLLVSHQMLNEHAHTIRSDVHWGLLMSNDMRWLDMDVVLDPKREIYSDSHMHPLGEAGSATGDPARMAISPQGVVVVALSGVGEVAIGEEDDFSLARIKVGKRPTSVIMDREGKFAYVANTFEDSISVIDVKRRRRVHSISLGATPALTLREKGEHLFFDASLSHDSWMSCHSCHTDGHTNSMLNDNLSDSTFGAPKRVLSLLGKANTEPLAWNASVDEFHVQVRNSIVKTMQKDDPPSDEQVAALTAFVTSLPSPPSVDKARNTINPAKVKRGRQLFAKLNCNKCHAAPHYTTPKTYDVGLRDKLGNKTFNPPTLIGVSQRGPYFHDNRAKTLDDVFQVHGHQLEGKILTSEQLGELTAFLRSL